MKIKKQDKTFLILGLLGVVLISLWYSSGQLQEGMKGKSKKTDEEKQKKNEERQQKEEERLQQKRDNKEKAREKKEEAKRV